MDSSNFTASTDSKMGNTNGASLRLIAALALASHAPKARQPRKIPHPHPEVNPPTTGSSASSITSSSSSVATSSGSEESSRRLSGGSLEDIINDPIFCSALAQIRASVRSSDNSRGGLDDPKVQWAAHQAYLALQSPEMKAALANNSSGSGSASAPRSSWAHAPRWWGSPAASPSNYRNAPTGSQSEPNLTTNPPLPTSRTL